MHETKYLERTADFIDSLYSMAESRQDFVHFDALKRLIDEGADKRSVRGLVRSLEIAGYPDVAHSVSELARCAYWRVNPQKAVEAKANAVSALDRARTNVKHDQLIGLETESPERADFTAALIDAAILADEIAILGSAYQGSVEGLMFSDCVDAEDDDEGEDKDEGEDEDGEDLTDGPDTSTSTTVGDGTDEASTYEHELAALDVGTAVQRLRSHGATTAATALEDLHAAVSRVTGAIDTRKPLRGFEADRVEKVFDSDVYTLHRSVMLEINNKRAITEAADERDDAVKIDPPLYELPGPAFALARDDDGYLLVGPSFATTAQADDFIEKLAADLRGAAADDLDEISPRTFRPSHEVGEDYPGRQEFMALFSVSSVTLYVGTIKDVLAAWKTKQLFSQQEDLQMYSYVYRLAGFGGMF